MDFEKTNSISSDEGSYNLKNVTRNQASKVSSNSLTVQSFTNHLNQSMPNLASGPYQIANSSHLLVPGGNCNAPTKTHSSHSGNLLSPSQRGISYPPPSPPRWVFFLHFLLNFFFNFTFTNRVLRRGFAFSTSINNKNPPLIKSRNVNLQNWEVNNNTV